MLTVLKNVDQDLLRAAIAGERFAEYFYAIRGMTRSATICATCESFGNRMTGMNRAGRGSRRRGAIPTRTIL